MELAATLPLFFQMLFEGPRVAARDDDEDVVPGDDQLGMLFGRRLAAPDRPFDEAASGLEVGLARIFIVVNRAFGGAALERLVRLANGRLEQDPCGLTAVR